MPSTVEQLSPTRVKITVEVPFADFKPSMDKAYAAIAKSVNIPGFRKGKVPPMVIDQRFGRGVVIQEAFNDAWSGFYGQAVQENNLSPLAQPDLEVTKLEDGDLIEFTAEVDVRPDFELPDFAGIEATVEPLEVPEALVDKQVEGLQQRYGSQETVERPAAEGDVVTISLAASRDGEALPDATADDLDYTIGSDTMLEGLDEAVTGLSAGESATFSSILVGGARSGEEADVEVTVSKVQEQELPAADDELAQQASEFDTIEELRGDITERLTRVARLEQASQARDAVLQTLLDQLDLDVPDNLLDSELKARREQITSQLAQAGLTLDQYLVDTGEDQTEDEFWVEIEDRATPGDQGADGAGQGGRGPDDQRRPERPDPAHPAQGAVRRGRPAAGGRPPQGAPAPHRGVHARDPPGEGSRSDRRVRLGHRQQRREGRARHPGRGRHLRPGDPRDR